MTDPSIVVSSILLEHDLSVRIGREPGAVLKFVFSNIIVFTGGVVPSNTFLSDR